MYVSHAEILPGAVGGQELKAAVTSVNDSVSYLNAETGLLDQQVRPLSFLGRFSAQNRSSLSEAPSPSRVTHTGAQMRELERQTALVYTPFRAALFEYAVSVHLHRL
jgi:hypothetical protein